MKRASVITAVLLAAALLTGCVGPGANDWRYELPDGYAIWHINPSDITFGRETDGVLEPLVDGFVYSFCYGSGYVGLRCGDPPDTDKTGSGGTVYYLFRTSGGGELFGRYDEEGYLEAVSDPGIGEMSGWIDTKPAPKGAKYNW